MNWLSLSLLGMFLATSLVFVRADDADPKRAAGGKEKRSEDWKKLSDEEREMKGRDGRKTNGIPTRGELERRREQLKHMTPEERAAKRKEIMGRLEKRIAELRARQTNATITAQETRELERREQILKRFEQENSGGPRIERARPVFTNSPVEQK